MDDMDRLTWHLEQRNGRSVYVLADGRVIPHVCGSDGDDDPPAPEDPPGDPDPLEQLQSELNRIGARESAAGRRQAERELLQAAGFEDRAALEAFITAAREREEAELTETQRLQRQAEQREQAAAARETQAAEREHRALVRQAIVEAGVGNHLEDPAERTARRDAVMRLVDAEVGADESTIAAAIEQVRATVPELFAATTPANEPAPRAPSGFPRGPAPRTPAPANGKSRVDELVEGVKQRTGIR